MLRREDWLFGVSAMALVEIALGPDVLLRAGAYDDLRYVLGSGVVRHVVGPTLVLSLERLDAAVGEVLFFVRAGTFTHHERRGGEWTGLAGVIARYELGPL